MKIKALGTSLSLLATMLFLGGCGTAFQNYTPTQLPQNPSGIYTFSFSSDLPKGNRIEGTERAEITINGRTFPMKRSSSDDLAFFFDYKMPPGVSEARYYYTLRWDYRSESGTQTAVRYSTHQEKKVYTSQLRSRYAIQLVSDRGPAGSRIPIVGSGFSSQDVVVVGGVEATTTVHSANSMEFIVPAIPAGQAYHVLVRTGSGDLNVGSFRVDQANFTVSPASLYMNRGDMELLIVEIDNPAPFGGLLVNAQTDVPQSIIMSEIVIPEGSRSVSVTVTAGSPGSGTLVLSVPGYAEIEIPVTVN